MSGTIVPNNDPAAIESGNSWNGLDTAAAPVIVTFSFPTSMPSYDDSIAGFTPGTISSFTPFNAAEQAQAIAALNQWAAASGIIFVEVPPGQSDITFANIDFSTTTTTPQNGDFTNAAGIGFYPFGNWSYLTGNSSTGYGFTSDQSPAGAVFMNSNDVTSGGSVNLATGTVDLATLLHEIGHAIGMKHPDQVVTSPDGVLHNQILDPSENSGTLTIMSETGDAANDTNSTLFPLDQSAAAALYGPAGTGGVYTGSASGTNSVATWSWNATTDTLTQTAVSANETIHGTSVNDIIYGYDYGDSTPTTGTIALFGLDGTNTLYAGSGTTDLYGGPDTNTLVGGAGDDNFYVYSTATTVTDSDTTGNNTLYATGVNATLPENVDTLYLYGSGLTGTANNQNDTIFGDGTYSDTLVAGAGDDYLVGGSGGNTLVAGTGIALMFGGSGANTFIFNSAADAPVGNYNTYDELDGSPGNSIYGPEITTIGDFKEGTDKINLSAIMANGQELTFIGTAAFTDQAGQLRDFISSNGNTIIEGDLTGNGTASFEIELYGTVALQSTDFILSQAPCYCAGTSILTDHGEVPVEHLAIGDHIITPTGAKPIKWIGRRSYHAPLTADPKILPIRIAANALADATPTHDLHVSPEHAMLIDGLLVPAALLINDTTITQPTDIEEIHYFHIELDQHDVLLANGAWSETFVDDDSRLLFHNALDYKKRYPNAPDAPAIFCAPRITDGFALETIRQRLDQRAGLRDTEPTAPLRGFIDLVTEDRIEGWAQNPDNPETPVCLDIIVNNKIVAQTLADRYRPDLQRANLGSGRHAFRIQLPLSDPQKSKIEVRRSADRAPLTRRKAA